MTTKSDERLWTVDDLARFLGKSRATILTWRSRGIGPPALKIGRAVRYDPEVVREWLETQPG